MGLVFSMHNDLGRLYDEKIYQKELSYRCRKTGLESVLTEVPIQVSLRDYTKTYYIDLLINNSVMYELKAVTAITGDHRRQALNYLLLTGMHHGKLVNMRPESVEHRFVSTKLTPEKRYGFVIDDQRWQNIDEDSLWLKSLVENLLFEWGAFLDTNLFYDAIYHFRGGQDRAVRNLVVVNDSRVLGHQRVHVLNPTIAFRISSVTKDTRHYERNLQRFIHHTDLRAIQWINFSHRNIVFATIEKQSK